MDKPIEGTAIDQVERYLLPPGDGVPNNSLPLLVYRQAIALGDDPPAAFEARFSRHGWDNGWRNGIYGYHHFHSNAHEVLGIAKGDAAVRFGGPSGPVVKVGAGDVVVIPAGVAHKSEETSHDLLVVGAYPDGQDPDLCRPDAAALAGRAARVGAVATPGSDPVFGREGPLVAAWRAAR